MDRGMKILACIKQVVDAETAISVEKAGMRILFPANAVYRLNRYDEYALEEALRLNDRTGAQVHAVSIGPPRVESALRRALEMGAHAAFRLEAETTGEPETLAKARMIAAWASGGGYDLILAGMMSEDSMSCMFAPALAECLGAASATAVMGLDAQPVEGIVTVEREIDSRSREVVTLAFPAVLAVQSGINRPRYPSLSNVMRAKGQTIETVPPAPGAGSGCVPLQVRFREVPSRREGRFLQGSPGEKAASLCDYFHEVGIL
jgi:electron transfer flavoprotein beta subunit